MAGVTAADGKGEELTSSVEVDSSAVKTDTAGTYQATYKVTDKYGLTGNATSNVTVNEPAKEETVNNTDSGESSKNDSGKITQAAHIKRKTRRTTLQEVQIPKVHRQEQTLLEIHRAEVHLTVEVLAVRLTLKRVWQKLSMTDQSRTV